MALSHKKYAMDQLQDTRLMGYKPESTINQCPAFWDSSSKLLEDVHQYRRLIGKLIYLTITHPNISYAIGLLRQFNHEPRMVHW